MKKYLVEGETTLKKFTDSHYLQASFCFRSLLKEREIKVNGKRVSGDMPLQKGDEVEYFLTPARAQKTGYEVLYEDELLVAVDKDSGVDWEAVLNDLKEREEVFPVHRLDRNTEGVMLFARTLSAQEELILAFEERKIEKVYFCLVCGKMPQKHSIETAYLQKDEKRGEVKIFPAPPGERIVTEYYVVEERGDTSLLKIVLHTGKTHQIRAHLAYLHHPVLGDEKYGSHEMNKKYHLTRQRLLAKSLTLLCEGKFGYLKGVPFVSRKNL